MDIEDLQIKIARSENLPVLPQVVSAVMKLADDPDASPRDMEKLIERDPAIAAKILRVANSAYYGLNQAPSIGRAIGVLGVNAIKSLVTGIAYQQILSGKTGTKSFSKMQFWQHSLAVAIGARILGKLKSPAKAEEYYCAGMVHDLGLLVLDRFTPNELDRAIVKAIEDECDITIAEMEIFGFTHHAVGKMLGEKWGLSPLIQSCIANHDDPNPEDPHAEAVYHISMANTLAHQRGYTNNCPFAKMEFDPIAEAAISLPEEQLEVIRVVIAQEVQKAQDSFQMK